MEQSDDPVEIAARVCVRCDYSEFGASAGSTCPHDGSALLLQGIRDRYRDDALLGRVLGAKYAVIDVLGKGGMGFVYSAIQLPVGRRVAVKVIR